MNLLQHLLTKLAEESSEVAKIALKTQQFGLDESCAGNPLTNVQRIHQELDDLQASIEMLNDIGLCYVPDRSAIQDKKEKVARYLNYSCQLGMVEPGAYIACKALCVKEQQ